jgi:calcineurin-like phosphoesterase family protein
MIDAFYSDPHFGHKKIHLPDYADRPFSSTEEMDEELIRRYNLVVGPDDTCLWLGDFSFHPRERTIEIVKSLNGNKIMMIGNHDKGSRWLSEVGVGLVIENGYLTTQIAGRPVRACHYPYRYKNDRHDLETQKKYPDKRKGEILIHGHTHSKKQVNGNQINVCVDAWDYTPVAYNKIEELISKI